MDIAKNELDADSGPVNIGFDDCCGGARFGAGYSLMKLLISQRCFGTKLIRSKRLYDNGLYFVSL